MKGTKCGPSPMKMKGGSVGAPALKKMKVKKSGMKTGKPKFTYG